MNPKYIISIDQGTGSSRAVLFDKSRQAVAIEQTEIKSLIPDTDCVEQDAEEIWQKQLDVTRRLIRNHQLTGSDIAAIGITNQRETTVVWDKQSGKPVYHALVWQDKRSLEHCRRLIEEGYAPLIQEKTGLIPDAYFSASKLAWILDHVEGVRDRAEQGNLLFGTIDTWLIWNLSGGSAHITDTSNASRTMLFNIHTCCWDQELLDLFHIPASMMPRVVDSSAVSAHTAPECFDGISIPIAGIAGDQQAALYGQCCLKAGAAKNTYGTGCFMLMNTGSQAVKSASGLLTTIAWTIGGSTTYALEGSVFHAGSAVKWLRDQLHLIPDAASTDAICRQHERIAGLYLVPAFSGLGAPWWDMDARGLLCGLCLQVSAGHIVRAVIESIAYQSYDLLRAMANDSGIGPGELKVDGGASVNDFLMQFQSDLIQAPVVRPRMVEATALGAALLAGRACGFWTPEEIEAGSHDVKIFYPSMAQEERDALYAGWLKAVTKSRDSGR
jgi:glycerol kinase